MPAWIEILPEARTDGPLLDDGERRGQRAGAQQDRRGCWPARTVKRPEIWPAPPVIGCWMRGAEITLLVEHDGERPADGFGRHLPEALRAADVEAEVDDGLAGALVEGGLGVDEILALHDDAALHLTAGRPSSLEGSISTSPGGAPGSRERRNSSWAVVPRMSFRRRGSCRPGHLHQNAVRALALDVRLRRAQRVDAAAQHLDGLVDGLAHALVDAGFGDRRADQPVGLLARSRWRLAAALRRGRRADRRATAPAAAASAARARPRRARGR